MSIRNRIVGKFKDATGIYCFFGNQNIFGQMPGQRISDSNFINTPTVITVLITMVNGLMVHGWLSCETLSGPKTVFEIPPDFNQCNRPLVSQDQRETAGVPAVKKFMITALLHELYQ